MYDYLSSKLVWIVVAIVMTSSVLGLFIWQQERSQEIELNARASGIQEIINEFCNTDGEIKGIVSSNQSTPSDFDIESTINGERYELNFTANGLYLIQGDKRVWNRFIEDVYIYNPIFLDRTTPKRVLDNINLDIKYLNITSDQDFYVESIRFNDRHHVFIYHDIRGIIKNESKRVNEVIQDLKDWSYEKPEKKQNITLRENIIFRNFHYYVDDDCISPLNLENTYLFEPEINNISWNELEELAVEFEEIIVKKGEIVTIESKIIEVDGSHIVLNFLYVPGQSPLN